jgi:hypothetical protein
MNNLLPRLDAHIRQLAPHEAVCESGQLLIESRASITSLTSRLEGAEAERDRQYDDNVKRIANERAMEVRAEAAEALVAELREALKPFAAEYATWPGGFTESTVPSIVVPGLEPTEAEFTFGDLGRASRLCAKDPSNNASQP